MRNLYLAFFSLLCSFTFAQTGTISGKITDAKTGEEIIGANVSIQGTQIGAATDLEGKFTIANVKPGSYNLVVSFITYKTHIIPDVVVETNRISTITVSMQEESQELEEVVVMGRREINTDFALLKAIKESKLVVTGISAEQIAKSQDRDAAQVMRRVPGITIQENRFIVVRGLSSRYSSVVLNGVFAPSTETDSRAFSFDIIPSGLIDQILVYKTGAAWLPGDYAGAVVQITTKNVVDENFINGAFSLGYRKNTTFTTRESQQRADTEWLGFDNSSRSLPKNAPADYSALGFNPTLIELESRKWKNTWGLEQVNVLPDMRFNLNFGKGFSLGGMKLSTINGLTYSNTSQYNDASFNRYYNYTGDFTSDTHFSYMDNQLTNNVRMGLLSNWSLVINTRNKIEFRNLLNNIGANETIIRGGDNFFREQNYRNYSYRYIGRNSYLGQLEGRHELFPEKLTLTWLAGYTQAKRNEPDWRRLVTARPLGSGEDTPYVVNINSSVSVVNSARFFQELNEQSFTSRMDFDYNFNKPSANKDPFQLKFGYWFEYKDRNFDTRTIAHVARDGINPDIASLPYDQIFNPAYVAYNGGHYIDERRRPQDSYTATNQLIAGYVSMDMPLSEKFRMVAGLRVEHNIQKLQSAPGVGATSVNNPITSILPFVNTTYNLTASSLLRLAYSKTLNRPEFRELAEFSYYDFQYAIDIQGNPNLKIADIHNVDLRWEYYPTPSESVTIGTFYKLFSNPIETFLRTGTDNAAIAYTNAKEATSIGAEVEIRKAIAYSSSSSFLNNSFLVFNASFIHNQIELNDNIGTELQKRPMQGQSPYIVNLGYYFEDKNHGIQANVQYNVFGKRIVFVGNQQFPTWWEMPRHMVDLNFSKTINKSLELRFGIGDLLNAKWQLREDPDLDNDVSDVNKNKVVRNTRNGQLFTLGLGFRF